MSMILTLLAALVATGTCAYHRSSLRTWAIATIAATLVVGLIVHAPWTTAILLVIELAIALPLLLVDFRRRQISLPLLKLFAQVTPKLSETEQTALEAGTVGFEGELFSGKPDWHELLKQPKPELSGEEQAFLDGPVEELCAMMADWQIIPKRYGGLQFSALAHSAVLQKLSTMSATVSSTVAVPNSIGPAELLLHYGSDGQKDHYLPRLASGEEIPCFALTGPYAGSDATSLPDYGIVCRQELDGIDTLGIRLTFDKRYITLAPIAT